MPFRIDADEATPDTDLDGDGEDEATLTLKLAKLAMQIEFGTMEGTEADADTTAIDVVAAKRMYNMALAVHACSNTAEAAEQAVYTRPGADADAAAIPCGEDTLHTRPPLRGS